MPKPLLEALRGKTLPRPPFWFMRQAGRYLPEYRALREKAGSFLDLCLTPAHAIEVTLQPLRRFSMDGAILFSDILMVPMALGRDLRFSEGKGPILNPLRREGDIPKFDPDAFDRRLSPVYETVAGIKEALDDKTALIGFAGAPWTVASYMVEGGTSRDFFQVKSWAYERPAEFGRLIDGLVEATAHYLVRQIEAGAEALQIFDSWAGVLSHSQLLRWSLRPIQEIVARVRQIHPEVPIIVFPKGVGVAYIDFCNPDFCDALSLDSGMPRQWAKENLQAKVTLQGNLDPLALVSGGNAMVAEARDILERFGAGPFIFNLGHGIVPETPLENVATLCDFIRNWQSHGT